MLSKVSSSLNNLAKPKISSLEQLAPFLSYLNCRANINKRYQNRRTDDYRATQPHLFMRRIIAYKSLTLLIKSSRSSAVFLISPLREIWISFAISFTVSWRNFAYSSLAFSLLFNASCRLIINNWTNTLLDNGALQDSENTHPTRARRGLSGEDTSHLRYPTSSINSDKWKQDAREAIRFNKLLIF